MSGEKHLLNEKATLALQNNPKYSRYVQWAIQNGAIFDKVIKIVMFYSRIDRFSGRVWKWTVGWVSMQGGY
jgi:hypothetical protein